jgi:uncharacterized iron-regulated membrane protein
VSRSQRDRRGQARLLRLARRVHRTTGILLFAFFLFIACTGLLLGWKKHSAGYLLPDSRDGVSSDVSDWLPMTALHANALAFARDSISADISPELDRIDIRPDKGMVKFVFVEDYWGLQLDCTTGELLLIEKRRSDFIEDLHDGSIVDAILGTSDEQIKLMYTSLMGSALLIFSITGFWLWIGPRRLRKARSEERALHQAVDRPIGVQSAPARSIGNDDDPRAR